MAKQHCAALLIVGLCLLGANAWQLHVGAQSTHPVWVSYGIWLALDLAMIGTLFRLGRVRVHTPPQRELPLPGFVLFILGAAACYALATNAASALLSALDPSASTQLAEAHGVHASSTKHSLWPILWPILVAPLAEELIFRVGLLGILLQYVRRPTAIVISALVFALSHAAIYPPVAVFGTFIFGLVAGSTYLLLGLPAAVLLHLYANSDDLYRPLLGGFWLKAYVVLMFASFFYFLYQLVRRRRVVLG